MHLQRQQGIVLTLALLFLLVPVPGRTEDAQAKPEEEQSESSSSFLECLVEARVNKVEKRADVDAEIAKQLDLKEDAIGRLGVAMIEITVVKAAPKPGNNEGLREAGRKLRADRRLLRAVQQGRQTGEGRSPPLRLLGLRRIPSLRRAREGNLDDPRGPSELTRRKPGTSRPSLNHRGGMAASLGPEAAVPLSFQRTPPAAVIPG